ncbi:hypothetical protein EUZ87_13570 [Lactiplantibacillus paraplantarum]|uniref:Uncharacterized protein n=1 Tax=Lactiplantibacillus paraplantarum TaxID=60520 RepID=A0A4Q9XYT5_9LACO|nr:hypothetical protein EUZ87_13570 [Lactiplantibacillus paraplantarum]
MTLNYKYGLLNNLWWLPLVFSSLFKFTGKLIFGLIVALVLVYVLMWQIQKRYPKYNAKAYTNSIWGWGGLTVLAVIDMMIFSKNNTLFFALLMLGCVVRDSLAVRK